MGFVAFWLACGLVGGIIASSKGGSAVAGFLVAFILGPLGIIVALFMGSDAQKVEKLVSSGQMKKCPQCAEAVLPDALICKHCGHAFHTA